MDIYSIQLKYVARFVLTSLLLLRPRSPFSKSAFTAHIVVSSTAAATAIRVYVGKVGCNPIHMGDSYHVYPIGWPPPIG